MKPKHETLFNAMSGIDPDLVAETATLTAPSRFERLGNILQRSITAVICAGLVIGMFAMFRFLPALTPPDVAGTPGETETEPTDIEKESNIHIDPNVPETDEPVIDPAILAGCLEKTDDHTLTFSSDADVDSYYLGQAVHAALHKMLQDGENPEDIDRIVLRPFLTTLTLGVKIDVSENNVIDVSVTSLQAYEGKTLPLDDGDSFLLQSEGYMTFFFMEDQVIIFPGSTQSDNIYYHRSLGLGHLPTAGKLTSTDDGKTYEVNYAYRQATELDGGTMLIYEATSASLSEEAMELEALIFDCFASTHDFYFQRGTVTIGADGAVMKETLTQSMRDFFGVRYLFDLFEEYKTIKDLDPSLTLRDYYPRDDWSEWDELFEETKPNDTKPPITYPYPPETEPDTTPPDTAISTPDPDVEDIFLSDEGELYLTHFDAAKLNEFLRTQYLDGWDIEAIDKLHIGQVTLTIHVRVTTTFDVYVYAGAITFAGHTHALPENYYEALGTPLSENPRTVMMTASDDYFVLHHHYQNVTYIATKDGKLYYFDAVSSVREGAAPSRITLNQQYDGKYLYYSRIQEKFTGIAEQVVGGILSKAVSPHELYEEQGYIEFTENGLVFTVMEQRSIGDVFNLEEELENWKTSTGDFDGFTLDDLFAENAKTYPLGELCDYSPPDHAD